ncbi:Uncharacterised protein [Niallia circulans]|nr:Uncharacterised protein [Niallia circulans]
MKKLNLEQAKPKIGLSYTRPYDCFPPCETDNSNQDMIDLAYKGNLNRQVGQWYD